MVQRVEFRDAAKALELDHRMASAQTAYEQAGLEQVTKKAFHRERQFKAWGCWVDGSKGRIGVPHETRKEA